MIISELEGSLFSALIKIGGIRIEDEALIKLHMNYEDNNTNQTTGDIILDKLNINKYMISQSTIKYNNPVISEIDVYTPSSHYHCKLHRNIEFKPGYINLKLEFSDDTGETQCLCTVAYFARPGADSCSAMKYENECFVYDYSNIMQIYRKATRTRDDIIRFASCIIRALNQRFCEHPIYWDEIIKSDNDRRFNYVNLPSYNELIQIVYNILAYNMGYSNYRYYKNNFIQFTIVKEIVELTNHIYKSYILRIFKEILLGTNGSGIIRNEDGSATIKFNPPECDEASGEEPYYSKDMEFNITVPYYNAFIDAILLRDSNVHNFSYPNKALDVL